MDPSTAADDAALCLLCAAAGCRRAVVVAALEEIRCAHGFEMELLAASEATGGAAPDVPTEDDNGNPAPVLPRLLEEASDIPGLRATPPADGEPSAVHPGFCAARHTQTGRVWVAVGYGGETPVHMVYAKGAFAGKKVTIGVGEDAVTAAMHGGCVAAAEALYPGVLACLEAQGLVAPQPRRAKAGLNESMLATAGSSIAPSHPQERGGRGRGENMNATGGSSAGGGGSTPAAPPTCTSGGGAVSIASGGAARPRYLRDVTFAGHSLAGGVATVVAVLVSNLHGKRCPRHRLIPNSPTGPSLVAYGAPQILVQKGWGSDAVLAGVKTCRWYIHSSDLIPRCLGSSTVVNSATVAARLGLPVHTVKQATWKHLREAYTPPTPRVVFLTGTGGAAAMQAGQPMECLRQMTLRLERLTPASLEDHLLGKYYTALVAGSGGRVAQPVAWTSRARPADVQHDIDTAPMFAAYRERRVKASEAAGAIADAKLQTQDVAGHEDAVQKVKADNAFNQQLLRWYNDSAVDAAEVVDVVGTHATKACMIARDESIDVAARLVLLDAAAAYLDNALASFPKYSNILNSTRATTFNNRACVHRKNGDLLSTLQDLQNAAQAAPSYEVFSNISAMYLKTGAYPEALLAAQKALEALPDDGPATSAACAGGPMSERGDGLGGGGSAGAAASTYSFTGTTRERLAKQFPIGTRVALRATGAAGVVESHHRGRVGVRLDGEDACEGCLPTALTCEDASVAWPAGTQVVVAGSSTGQGCWMGVVTGHARGRVGVKDNSSGATRGCLPDQLAACGCGVERRVSELFCLHNLLVAASGMQILTASEFDRVDKCEQRAADLLGALGRHTTATTMRPRITALRKRIHALHHPHHIRQRQLRDFQKQQQRAQASEASGQLSITSGSTGSTLPTPTPSAANRLLYNESNYIHRRDAALASATSGKGSALTPIGSRQASEASGAGSRALVEAGGPAPSRGTTPQLPPLRSDPRAAYAVAAASRQSRRTEVARKHTPHPVGYYEPKVIDPVYLAKRAAAWQTRTPPGLLMQREALWDNDTHRLMLEKNPNNRAFNENYTLAQFYHAQLIQQTHKTRPISPRHALLVEKTIYKETTKRKTLLRAERCTRRALKHAELRCKLETSEFNEREAVQRLFVRDSRALQRLLDTTSVLIDGQLDLEERVMDAHDEVVADEDAAAGALKFRAGMLRCLSQEYAIRNITLRDEARDREVVLRDARHHVDEIMLMETVPAVPRMGRALSMRAGHVPPRGGSAASRGSRLSVSDAASVHTPLSPSARGGGVSPTLSPRHSLGGSAGPRRTRVGIHV